MPKKNFIACAAAIAIWTAPAALVAEDAATFELTIKDKAFQPAELKVPANRPLILKIKNLDAAPEEFESTALRVEKIVAPQTEITVRVKPLKPGRHEFHGEYNPDTATGALLAE